MASNAQMERERDATRVAPGTSERTSEHPGGSSATASQGPRGVLRPPETRQSRNMNASDDTAPSASSQDHGAPSSGVERRVDPTVAASTRTITLSVPPPSSPGSDPLAIPSAAQPFRASTPVRRSKSPAAVPPSSASSSGDTVAVPARTSSKDVPPSSDPYPDQAGSDDSLRLMPLDCSATKSTSGAARTRSQTRSISPAGRDSPEEEGGGTSRSSPPAGSSNSARRPAARNKPGPRNTSGPGNVSTRDKASRTEQIRSRPLAIEEDDGAASSDDELALVVASSQIDLVPKKKARRKSNFLCVDVPPPSSSTRSSSTSTPKASVQPTSARCSPPPTSSIPSPQSGGDDPCTNDDLEKASERESVENRGGREGEQSATPGSRHSSPPGMRSSVPVEATTLSRPGAAEAEDRAPSSPLSSVPSTSPTHLDDLRLVTSPEPESTTTMTASFVASKRPLSPCSSSSFDETAADQEDRTGTRGTTEHGSPKKKARVPKGYVKPVDPAPVSTATGDRPRGKGKGRTGDGAGAERAVKIKKNARGGGGGTESRRDANHDDVAEVPDVEAGPSRALANGSGDGWAVRPKRGKSVKRNLREEPSDAEGTDGDEDDGDRAGAGRFEGASSDTLYSSPAKKRRPAASTKSKASAVGKGKKSEQTDRRVKGKGKGKGKATKPTDDDDMEGTARGTFPSVAKNAMRATSSFLLELSQPSQSKPESAQERAKGWDVREFDDYVWVHVDEDQDGGKGGFWWIGRITNKLRSERPLSIELFVDPARTILENSPGPIVRIAEPLPDNVLKFRSKYSPSSLRFTRDTYRDSNDATPSVKDLDEAFEAVLSKALQLESSFGEEGDSDDSDALPDPSQLGTSQRSKKGSRNKPKSSSDAEQRNDESESEEELLKEQDEVASFPFYCLAKEQGGWWAANCLGYADAPVESNRAKARGASKPKFNIEYPSGHTAVLPRSSLLFSRQKQFARVKIQESIVEFPPQYLDNAIAFIKRICPEELQQVLDESYAPAQSRNDAFHAGGRAREQLAQTSVFGELPTEFIEEISDTITAWLLPPTGPRPTGSPRYEALAKLERVAYVADVLLPCAIVLNYIDDLADGDEPLEARVRTVFAARGGPDPPSQAEVDLAVYEQAYKDLNSRSATKAVKSMREGRKAAENQRAARRNK